MNALEAMQTCRAMRYLKPDPVPEELIRDVIRAATCASSPGNSQGWEFVVVRDAERRKAIGQAIRADLKPLIPASATEQDPSRRRMLAGLHHLLDSLERVPVLIFVCGAAVYPPQRPSAEWIAPALLPAAQNLIVAARSLGLGTVFTMLHRASEKRVREILALPEAVRIEVTIPLGWPARNFGPLRRRPLDDVIHWDAW